MPEVPKPRKSGHSGGSAYNRTNRATHASARVHQKAAKSSKGGCVVLVLGLGTTMAFQGSYVAYSLFSLVS